MIYFFDTKIYSAHEKLSTLWSLLPWSQNRTILSKCKTEEEKIFKDSYLLDFLNLPDNHSEKDEIIINYRFKDLVNKVNENS